jgi:hypothetical protein
MPRKLHEPEEVVAKLRQVDVFSRTASTCRLRSGQLLKMSGYELFSVAHHPSIKLFTSQPEEASP